MKGHLAAVGLLIALFTGVDGQRCLDTAKEIKPVLSEERIAEFQGRIHNERTEYSINPDNLTNIVWLGRFLAYTGEYKAAIKIYTDGLNWNPRAPEIYRHRGHRYITLRCFDDAIKDLEKAAALIKGKPDEIELDGLPNAKNIPTSTLQSNIWYHLGLAYYLKGDFKRALNAYNECEKVSKNPDMLVATKHWQYMTLRRLGRKDEAKKSIEAIPADLQLIENDDYYKLIKLYKGIASGDALLKEFGEKPDSVSRATLGYGLGNRYLYHNMRNEATKIFREFLAGKQWASFGYIAAEADLMKLSN